MATDRTFYGVQLDNGIQIAGPFDTFEEAQKACSDLGAGRPFKDEHPSEGPADKANPEPQEMTMDWVRGMDGAA